MRIPDSDYKTDTICTYLIAIISICTLLYFICAFYSLAVVSYSRRILRLHEVSNLPFPLNLPLPFLATEQVQLIDPPDGHYVSMCAINFDDRRLGNQLFNFAALLYVTKQANKIASRFRIGLKDIKVNGSNYSAWNYTKMSTQLTQVKNRTAMPLREPIMPARHPYGWLDQWFDIRMKRYRPGQGRVTEGLCPPCSMVDEERGLAFSTTLLSQLKTLVRNYSSHRAFLMCGWFQSWKYTIGIEKELRRQLRFNDHIINQVEQFMDINLPCRSAAEENCNTTDQLLRVGVHVRRSDILKEQSTRFGYTAASREYIKRAMEYFTVNTTKLIQFIFVSDDMDWTREAIRLNGLIDNNTRLLFSDHPISPAFDLAVLSRCDAVIMTTGTFGWWGAWLANGTTIYYSGWPMKNSNLELLFNRDDFFPPSWIPMA